MKKENFEIIQLSKEGHISEYIRRKEIYSFLIMLNLEYPGFKKWYNNLYTNNGDLKNDREILLCKINDEVAGVSILKSDINEKKICTFRIKDKFQRQGIGKVLMEKSFEYLNTEKPLITIHKSKENQFEKLFKYYGFNLEQENKNYYRFFNTELAFNGELPKKEIWLNKFEIANFEPEILKRLHNDVYEEIYEIVESYLKSFKYKYDIIK